MGMHELGLMEQMVELRVLASENIDTLRKMFYKDEHDTLQVHERIRRIEEIVDKLQYHWQHVPQEWHDAKLRGQGGK
jgi:hypothetical protein